MILGHYCFDQYTFTTASMSAHDEAGFRKSFNLNCLEYCFSHILYEPQRLEAILMLLVYVKYS